MKQPFVFYSFYCLFWLRTNQYYVFFLYNLFEKSAIYRYFITMLLFIIHIIVYSRIVNTLIVSPIFMDFIFFFVSLRDFNLIN